MEKLEETVQAVNKNLINSEKDAKNNILLKFP